MVTSPSEQHKTFFFKPKKNKKTKKQKKLFSIPNPKLIPTLNRHLREKPNPIPTEVKKSSPQGRALIYLKCIFHRFSAHSAMADQARQMLRECASDLNELSACRDCYREVKY
jgi:hypothetical protein